MRASDADVAQETEDVTCTGEEIAQEKQHAEISDVKAAQNRAESSRGRMPGLQPES